MGFSPENPASKITWGVIAQSQRCTILSIATLALRACISKSGSKSNKYGPCVVLKPVIYDNKPFGCGFLGTYLCGEVGSPLE